MYLSLTLLSLTSILGLATGCCVFNGIAYEEGETITDACVQLICRQPSRGVYKWYILSNQISEKCDDCCIRDDPHINTFDRFAGTYGWHETCRYSLAEYIESWGMKYPPPTKFAVYGDFKTCVGRPIYSCVHYTSYQLDALPDNVLHVNHSDVCTIYNHDFGFSTVISPNQPPTPVIINNVNYNALAWKHGDCLRILGADLLVHICDGYVCIYTSTNNLNHLGGLCGKYNHLEQDDHTGRNHFLYTNVPPFALTWQVDPLPIGDEDCENDILKLRGFECKEEELAKSKEICARYLEKCTADKETLISIINSCAEDLCPSPRGQDHWLEVALKFCLYQASNNDITIKG